MIASLCIVFILLKKFHRRTDLRIRISGCNAYGTNDWFFRRIVDMPEIPGEEIVNSVHGGDRNMQCIGFSTVVF
jgi:hypothetical protein